MSKRLFPVIGKNLYPTPQGSPGAERVERTPLRRCMQCGLPNDTRTTAYSKSGEGLSEPYVVESDTNTMDRDVVAGCRFCGSMNWAPHRPAVLPDGRNYPADQWRRKRKRR